VKILHSIQDLASLPGPVVLAAGTFDGLHLGHQALIRCSLEEAQERGGTAVVMSFNRHPASVVRPERAPGLLTTSETKLSLLKEMHVPAFLLLDFTPDLSKVQAEEFIESLVSASKPLSMICVGSQWSFGNGGKGNIPLLIELGLKFGFSVKRIDPVEVSGLPISSTRVREAIAQGDFQQVLSCLGRKWLLNGKIVTGAGLGAGIGFPTANLDAKGMQLPPDGVYAVRVSLGGRLLSGVCNIGVRPTIEANQARTVEVHLFDFSEDLVGKDLSLEFVKFLRPERKFSGLSELSAQIARDCDEAKALVS